MRGTTLRSIFAAAVTVSALTALPGLAGAAPATTPMREHHKALLQHLEHVWHFAETVGTGDYTTEREQAAAIGKWLAANIKPHAEAEERYLYPHVARLMGAKAATRTMSIDHRFVARHITSIAAAVPTGGTRWEPASLNHLRAELYRLQGILLPHFAKEEEVYLHPGS